MSCSRTQHGGGRFRTPDLSLRSRTLYHWATALPEAKLWIIFKQNCGSCKATLLLLWIKFYKKISEILRFYFMNLCWRTVMTVFSLLLWSNFLLVTIKFLYQKQFRGSLLPFNRLRSSYSDAHALFQQVYRTVTIHLEKKRCEFQVICWGGGTGKGGEAGGCINFCKDNAILEEKFTHFLVKNFEQTCRGIHICAKTWFSLWRPSLKVLHLVTKLPIILETD